MKTSTQTQLISVLVFTALMLALLFALFTSGLMNTGEPPAATAANIWGTPTDEIIPAENINIKISGTRLRATFTGTSDSNIQWNFGDGTGSTAGHSVLHNYSSEGRYLVTMFERTANGHHRTEYMVANIDAGNLVSINVPGMNENIVLAIASLIFAGISALILAILSLYYDNVPPKAFTFKQRVILGLGLIFSAILALGYFNSLAGAG
jgi:hypothetical protein